MGGPAAFSADSDVEGGCGAYGIEERRELAELEGAAGVLGGDGGEDDAGHFGWVGGWLWFFVLVWLG